MDYVSLPSCLLDLSPMRRVRNIDFCRQDLEPLLPGKRQKISNTTLDAYAAVIQLEASEIPASPCGYRVFSSRIAALASGAAPEAKSGESIEGHVLEAVSQHTHVLPI